MDRESPGARRGLHQEARALELDAEAALQRSQSRPEVVAWRQLTAPFVKLIGRSRSPRAVGEVLQDAERQGLVDECLRLDRLIMGRGRFESLKSKGFGFG